MSNNPDSSMHAKPPAPGPPCVMVIFGAGGDLAKRLLVPALYNLAASGLLDERFKVLGADHNPGDDAQFRTDLEASVQALAGDRSSEFGAHRIDQSMLNWLGDRLHYQVTDFTKPPSFVHLSRRLQEVGGENPNVIFYLAVSSQFFGEIVENLANSGLLKEPPGGFRRVVVEKPFGKSLDTARNLNVSLLKYLREPQIYRIDHFLGKETVRNIMVTRFANGFFEPLWSRLHIDHIQITAAEAIGIEQRGSFYEKTGALRDMVPNHLFQILAMIAMEPPNSFDPDPVRAEKSRVFEAIAVQTREQALANGVRGQYLAGEVNGQNIADYRHEPDVSPESNVETYVALKFTIENWRWAGVPFYLRTGKALRRRDTEVAIYFKAAPTKMFEGCPERLPACNTLVMRIQPDEGVALHFEAKQPGPDILPHPVEMNFRYADFFASGTSTGYETLLYDCLMGDQTLFKRADDIEFAWRAVQPFLDVWAEAGEVHGYVAGSDGPEAADQLLARDGRSWRALG